MKNENIKKGTKTMEKGTIYTNGNKDEDLVFVQIEGEYFLFLDRNMGLKRVSQKDFDIRNYKTFGCNKKLNNIVEFIIDQMSVNKYVEDEIENLKENNKLLDSELSNSQYNCQLESIEINGTYRNKFDTGFLLTTTPQNFVVITNIGEEYVYGVKFNSELIQSFSYNIEYFKFEYEKCDIKVNGKLMDLLKMLISPELEKNDELDRLRKEYDMKQYQKDTIKRYVNNVWPNP